MIGLGAIAEGFKGYNEGYDKASEQRDSREDRALRLQREAEDRKLKLQSDKLKMSEQTIKGQNLETYNAEIQKELKEYKAFMARTEGKDVQRAAISIAKAPEAQVPGTVEAINNELKGNGVYRSLSGDKPIALPSVNNASHYRQLQSLLSSAGMPAEREDIERVANSGFQIVGKDGKLIDLVSAMAALGLNSTTMKPEDSLAIKQQIDYTYGGGKAAVSGNKESLEAAGDVQEAPAAEAAEPTQETPAAEASEPIGRSFTPEEGSALMRKVAQLGGVTVDPIPRTSATTRMSAEELIQEQADSLIDPSIDRNSTEYYELFKATYKDLKGAGKAVGGAGADDTLVKRINGLQKVIDSSTSTAEQKAAAKQQMAKLADPETTGMKTLEYKNSLGDKATVGAMEQTLGIDELGKLTPERAKEIGVMEQKLKEQMIHDKGTPKKVLEVQQKEASSLPAQAHAVGNLVDLNKLAKKYYKNGVMDAGYLDDAAQALGVRTYPGDAKRTQAEVDARIKFVIMQQLKALQGSQTSNKDYTRLVDIIDGPNGAQEAIKSGLLQTYTNSLVTGYNNTRDIASRNKQHTYVKQADEIMSTYKAKHVVNKDAKVGQKVLNKRDGKYYIKQPNGKYKLAE